MDTHATAEQSKAAVSTHAVRLIVGLALIAFWWPVAWREVRPISDYYFFPLWLGFILSLDGIVGLRSGTSPITRNGRRVVWLFFASSVLWWIFELINEIVGNWNYHAPAVYTRFEYFLLASLAFSTVIPAVLTLTELVRSLRLNPLRSFPSLRVTRSRLLCYHLAGWLIVALTVIAPSVFFPLVWFSLIFLLDPVVTVLGGRSIARFLERGDWSVVSNLGIATLVCGFFWEMWNIYSLPKWTYDIPYAEWLHVFEMPLLGYGGYIPFGLEVYVFYELCRVLAQRSAATLPDAYVSSQDQTPTMNPVLAAD